MKTQLVVIFCLYFTFSISQSNTDIFLFDVEINNKKIELKNGRNISNNEGYDNQPSFLNDDTILFASSRMGQTDIAKYSTKDNTVTYINATKGGEYSPLKTPNKDGVSAVRLDTDGKQRLYFYNLENGQSKELIKELVVAYYVWLNDDVIVSAVIEGEQLNLYVTSLKEGTSKMLATNVGRSLHKIPNSNLVSFISKENDKQWQIKSLNPLTGATKLIANTIKDIKDICWLNSKNLLSGKGSTLYKLTLQQDYNWKEVRNLDAYGIVDITRMAVNDSGSKLLIAGDIAAGSNISDGLQETLGVIEEKAAEMVDKHIAPFNNRELNKFSEAFNTDVTVNRFPAENMYTGRDMLKKNYESFYQKNDNVNVKVLKRMVLKNVVVDEELVTIGNTTKRQVTIYETDDNGIKSMTFIANSKTRKKTEAIINEQLEYYNKKDIKSFGRTYANSVEVYNFPNTISIEGRSALRNQYITLFDSTPNLRAEIVGRIIIGNKVIDKEKVTINDRTVYAIAIYEVKNSLINRVTFIQ